VALVEGSVDILARDAALVKGVVLRRMWILYAAPFRCNGIVTLNCKEKFTERGRRVEEQRSGAFFQ